MDAEHFKKEFLPYHRKLYCVAYRLLENAADAEDLGAGSLSEAVGQARRADGYQQSGSIQCHSGEEHVL